MELIATCPNCDARYRIDLRHAAVRAIQRVRCKQCNRLFSLSDAFRSDDAETASEGGDRAEDITIFDNAAPLSALADSDAVPLLNFETAPVELAEEEEPFGELTPETAVLLEVMRGRNRGLVLRLVHDETTIGRLGTDVMLTDAKISRCHASVVKQGRHLLVRDMNSTNGTYLNGNRVQERLLRDGDSIAIGDTLIRIHFEQL
ncbi:MAG: FHA domain-containing protein [Candidatus Schekmanbacteria bacterium]|nr:FHA domain-containing protein [Candidatus Schekmanbacteria bacterium]